MIMVAQTRVRHGYTGWDHLISGTECDAIVGREFRSLRDARRAIATEYRAQADKRCRYAPVAFLAIFAEKGSQWID